MLQDWSVLVITCPSISSVISTEKEITFLKKKGRIPSDLYVLAIEDPARNIGSGAATLNALLVATEHLSVKQNFMVISSDVLNDARILILHNGRNCLYTCTSNAFIPLPLEYAQVNSNQNALASGIVSNLESVLLLIDEISKNCPPGVWICSTDMMLLRGQESLVVNWENIADVVMFCVPSSVKYATGHGVVAIDNEDYVADILYCADENQIADIAQSDGKVPLVSGIVYLNVNVAESLLALHVRTPMDSCTYLGLDSGAEPIQVSLFFDILIAMSSRISKESFITGKCGKLYNLRVGIDQDSSEESICARSLVWNELSKYRMSPKILPGCQHLYWSAHDCGKNFMDNLFHIAKTNKVHSTIKADCHSISLHSLIVNSVVRVSGSCDIGQRSIIYDSLFKTSSLVIGENSFISGVTTKSQVDMAIPSDLFVIGTDVECFETRIIVMFGSEENLVKTVDVDGDTFCNVPLKQHFEALNISEDDLWPVCLNSNERTLINAKLFVPNFSLQDTLRLFQCTKNGGDFSPAYDKYKTAKRWSLTDVMNAVDYRRVFDFRRHLYAKISTDIIKNVLWKNEDTPLLPYFNAAAAEGWHLDAMSTIDLVLLSDESDTVAKTRALSNMADLLGAMAGPYGGLRSGPGSNPAWSAGFMLLMEGKTIEGLATLQKERSKWLDRPDHIMRAARHYERAVQILIQRSVKTAIQFLNVATVPLPEIGVDVIVECPARIDLQGGWSDTPPICYELGGSVVNVAVLIDGLKPIGASARRIKEPYITLNIKSKEINYEIKLTQLKEILDYDQPNARGALLKAAIVCANIVDVHSTQSLSEQLLSKFGGGFILKSWSLLPHGCGMGTSSILAGAIMSALWTVSGKSFNKLSVVHAVLYVEQLLTTGGGWQDQLSGVLGGINRGYSEDRLPLNVQAEQITLPPEFIEKLNGHLLLIHTGKVRLAKNLLQNVIRNWYAQEETVVKCFKDLVTHSHQMKEALQKGDLSRVGTLMDKYWEQKKILAPGCEPLVVKIMMEYLKPICYGQLLVGAGGGGFLCILTKEFHAKKAVQFILADLVEQFKIFKSYEKMSVHTVTIDSIGLQVMTSENETSESDFSR